MQAAFAMNDEEELSKVFPWALHFAAVIALSLCLFFGLQEPGGGGVLLGVGFERNEAYPTERPVAIPSFDRIEAPHTCPNWSRVHSNC